MNDPIHKWRAITGIELIHQEPTLDEQERIWQNWNLMTSKQKQQSDRRSLELFGKTNAEHNQEIVHINKIKETLKLIVRSLDKINYIFIGSANLYIQELKITPRDIDILTIGDGVKEIDSALKQYQTKEVYFDENKNSFRSLYSINDIELEVLANGNNFYRPINNSGGKVCLSLDGISLPCATLQSELSAYTTMGRHDRVKLIEDFLTK